MSTSLENIIEAKRKILAKLTREIKELTVETKTLIEFDISFIGTKYNTTRSDNVPLGSAVITSSGDLEKNGICNIIHAASGSSKIKDPDYEPTFDSVSKSVLNSIVLAEKNGIEYVILPFIGSGIFIGRIMKQESAQNILQTLKEELKRSNPKEIPDDKYLRKKLLCIEILNGIMQAYNIGNVKNVKVIMCLIDKDDIALFTSVYNNLNENDDRPLLDKQGFVITSDVCDITKYRNNTGKKMAIINAANTEVRFGAGISGFVNDAANDKHFIEKECEKIKEIFKNNWQTILSSSGYNVRPNNKGIIEIPLYK